MQQQSTDRNLFELFSKIRQNNHLRKKDKSKWLNYLNLSMRHFSWGQTLLHSFVKKDKSASIHLSFRDLWSLADEHGFLEDAVLDTVLNDCFQDQKKIGYIETSVFNAIENPFFSETTTTPFKNDKDAYIAVKNLNGNHWIFVFLNFKDKTLYVVDPQRDDVLIETSNKILKAFQEVHHNKMNLEASQTSKWNFINDAWKIATIDHNVQYDGCNCGIYCIKYALKIKKEFPVKPPYLFVGKNFNDARQLYTALLLNSSKPKQLETGKNKPKDANSSSKSIGEEGLVTTKRKRKKKKRTK